MKAVICATCGKEIKRNIICPEARFSPNDRMICGECIKSIKDNKFPRLVNFNIDKLNNIRKYELTLESNEDLERIKKFLDFEFQKCLILNEDSINSLHGGAACSFQIEIKIGEEWI